MKRAASLILIAALAASTPALAEKTAPAEKARPESLEAVVAGDWRLPADRARDRWRHPVETLKFVKPK